MPHIDELQPGELLPCPFCGAGETQLQVNNGVWTGMRYAEPVSFEVRHWCQRIEGQPSPRLIARVGRDRISAITAWNTRT